MFFQLTEKSSNAKTGDIAVSTSTRETCPTACPLYEKGCYASAGFFTRLHWQRVTSGERGDNWEVFLEKLRKLPPGTIFRHNVAGDLIGSNNEISETHLEQLSDATKHLKAFSYTHYPVNDKNLQALQKAGNFVINLSANNIAQSAEYWKTGSPVATIAPEDWGNETRTIGGIKYVTCPATYLERVTCKTCQLCASGERNCVVVFPAHGSQKKTVDIIARG